MRIRLSVSQDWVTDNERGFFYAGPCKGADVAAWKQSVLAEAAQTFSIPYISSLLDLIKAYDSVPFDHLSSKARKFKYNLYLLRLSLAAYLLARVLDIDGCCSRLVWATRGLAAGAVIATIELRVLLLEAGDRMSSLSPYNRLTLYVDDSTIETVAPVSRVISEHTRAVNSFVKELQDMRLDFSETKNVVCASTYALAEATITKMVGLVIKAASRVTSLGSGLGGGRTRNMKPLQKRLKVFCARRHRLKRLKASGVCTARLLRTGGNSAMLFGQRALGVSNSFLVAQRRAAAATTRVYGCGADLDLTLMVADAQSQGAADPAFEAHVGVLHTWALAVWEGWASPKLLQKVVVAAQQRLSGVKSVWSRVYGPAAALVATANRLGWTVMSASILFNDEGVKVDLMRDSPQYIKGLVVESVARWRWSKVAHRYPSLAKQGSFSGAACFRPIKKALFGKTTDQWAAQHQGAFKSLFCGRQWTQQRLFKAGLVEDNMCKLCRHFPGGDQVGTALHRHVCPALARFRELNQPQWLFDHLVRDGHQLTNGVRLALTRGLVPHLCAPVRDDHLFDSFWWHKRPFHNHIPSGCLIFTDGSLIDGKLEKPYQSLGWAFVVITSDGVLVAAAYGVPPKWVDTIQGAELWAVQMALQTVQFPSKLYTDCNSVRLGVQFSDQWAGSAKRRFARIWTVIHSAVEDNPSVVQWIPAHTAESSIGQKKCSDGLFVSEDYWSANQLADILAKDAAECIRIFEQDLRRIHAYENGVLELVKYLGLLTHEANNFRLPDGSYMRDSEALVKRKRRKKRVVQNDRSPTIMSKSVGKVVKRSTSGRWQSVYSASSTAPAKGIGKGNRARAASLHKVREAREQADFMSWWREGSVSRLQPKKEDAPSAKERLDALRQRLAAKNATLGT